MKLEDLVKSTSLACYFLILLSLGDNVDSKVNPDFHTCREYSVVCTSGGKIPDNCDIQKYREFMLLNMEANLETRFKRKSIIEIKKHFKELTDNCFIEVIVTRTGQLLYIRFSNRRALLSRSMFSSSKIPESLKVLKNFIDFMRRYEEPTSGMQMMVELDATQLCHKLWEPEKTYNPTVTFVARFAKRSSITYAPMLRYRPKTYEALTFQASYEEVLKLHARVTASEKLGDRVTQLLHLAKREPLIFWVYKCPAKMGLHKHMPCNSEVNLYIYLRQWINHTVLRPNNPEIIKIIHKWRYMSVTNDYFLLIVLTVTAFYLAIHLTCVTWIGLIPSDEIG